MQQADNQAIRVRVNDIGLLGIEQMPAFRQYLEAKGVPVRDSGSGQFFSVRLPGELRWLAIERGAAGFPVTSDKLRPFITGFINVPEVQSDRPAEELIEAAMQHSLRQPRPAAKPALSGYLSDLRDDFALHAPLYQGEAESLSAFANRRWEYADEMIKARSVMSGE